MLKLWENPMLSIEDRLEIASGEIDRLHSQIDAARAAIYEAEANQLTRPLRDENERLQELVRWAYSKLHSSTFSIMDDALKLDEMKLLLEHGK